ncbi:phosphotransferase enzyme family protein [Brachybacterium sp. AOP43-C2-M15]|uniref:phosphotransferase enzyme family protein n=1 Tax=Brachybacterium sp. AOP43-C2-M15 TaxID=3457661 RepID=UPI0040336F14
MDELSAMGQADRAAQVNAMHRPVVIAGEVVTRPSSAGTPTVHSFLRHLRAKGLDCVPEPIDVSDGVERLVYLEGESGGDSWYHQHTDEGLVSAARLLRRIHDAALDWEPPGDALWGAPAVAGTELVLCHGDPGPWNFVWREHEAVGLLDWDYLHPAPRIDDVAYALQWFAPTRSDALALEWHHFPEVPDRRHRIHTFLEAYGDLPDVDVVDALIARMQSTADLVRRLAESGQEPQRTWVDDGALDRSAAEISWVREHRAQLF